MEGLDATGLANQLPIAKYFGGDMQSTLKEAQANKGQAIATILKLLVIAGLGYAAWVYVIPPVMAAIGQTLAVVASAFIVIAAILILPSFFKWSGVIAKKVKKAAIKEDPFLELEHQEKQIIKQQELARAAKQDIKQLEVEMFENAKEQEELANQFNKQVIRLREDASKYKKQREALIAKHGEAAKQMDEYNDAEVNFRKTVDEGNRKFSQLEHSKMLAQKYAARGAIMKKMVHKLNLVEVNLDGKVHAFRASVEILKNDYKFASRSRAATDAAKSAMLFNKSWELEFALDTVSQAIAYDIAQTSGNFNDINQITANLDMNSDDMFEQLDELADSIIAGDNDPVETTSYRRENYDLTTKDREAAGGFGDIF